MDNNQVKIPDEVIKKFEESINFDSEKDSYILVVHKNEAINSIAFYRGSLMRNAWAAAIVVKELIEKYTFGNNNSKVISFK